AWAAMAEQAKSIYAADITYGPNANMRGHWLDRLPGIDADLRDMEERLAAASEAAATRTVDPAVVRLAVRAVLTRPHRLALAAAHTPPASVAPGKPLEIALPLDRVEGRAGNLLY